MNWVTVKGVNVGREQTKMEVAASRERRRWMMTDVAVVNWLHKGAMRYWQSDE